MDGSGRDSHHCDVESTRHPSVENGQKVQEKRVQRRPRLHLRPTLSVQLWKPSSEAVKRSQVGSREEGASKCR